MLHRPSTMMISRGLSALYPPLRNFADESPKPISKLLDFFSGMMQVTKEWIPWRHSPQSEEADELK